MSITCALTCQLWPPRGILCHSPAAVPAPAWLLPRPTNLPGDPSVLQPALGEQQGGRSWGLSGLQFPKVQDAPTAAWLECSLHLLTPQHLCLTLPSLGGTKGHRPTPPSFSDAPFPQLHRGFSLLSQSRSKGCSACEGMRVGETVHTQPEPLSAQLVFTEWTDGNGTQSWRPEGMGRDSAASGLGGGGASLSSPLLSLCLTLD